MAYIIKQYTSASTASVPGIFNINQAATITCSTATDSVPSGISESVEVEEGQPTQQVQLTFTEACVNATFNANNIYYLEATITNNSNLFLNKDRIISLKLRDSYTTANSTQQFVEDITVSFDNTQGGKTYQIKVIFKTIQEFKRIYFAFNRVLEDLIELKDKSIYIQSDYVKINSVKIVNLSEQQPIPDTANIVKLGIQGTPGLLMCINGEAIRIGPSGMYEIRNGYKISSFMILKQSETQRFILDLLINQENNTEE